MKCICGATLPVDARYSICDSCMKAGDPDDWDDDEEWDEELRRDEILERQEMEDFAQDDFYYDDEGW